MPESFEADLMKLLDEPGDLMICQKILVIRKAFATVEVVIASMSSSNWVGMYT